MSELRDRVERIVTQVVMETMGSTSGMRAGTGASGMDAGPSLSGVRLPLVAANWKMNMLRADTRAFALALELPADSAVEVLICPPLVLLAELREALGAASPVSLGAQDMHTAPKGAYTGEHSCVMLLDGGAGYVLVGHSERREMGEDDVLVQRKLAVALSVGLKPILCIGERRAEFEGGATFRVLRNQLTLALSGQAYPGPGPEALVVAYEPVWAIGTGLTATPAQAQEAMAFIRERLGELVSYQWARQVRLLYGGSVSPGNALALAEMPDIDGFLIGGASLDPARFSEIIAATARVKADMARQEGAR